MRTDAAEFVIEPIQVLCQQPYNLHAEVTVFPQKREELTARNKDCCRFGACLGGDPIVLPSHALAQSE